MNLPSLQQALARVISEMMARNRAHFGAGGPGYYGVNVDGLSSDGSEFDLTLTFKSGVRYCCIEHNCHIALYEGGSCVGWFKEVREGLGKAGFGSSLPPMTVAKLHVVVEKGVITESPPEGPHSWETKLEYDRGPFYEDRRPVEEPIAS